MKSWNTAPIRRRSSADVQLAQVDAVPQDRAAGRVVEPAQQLHQRALAGAVEPDQRDRLRRRRSAGPPRAAPTDGRRRSGTTRRAARSPRRSGGPARGSAGTGRSGPAVDDVEVVAEQQQRLVRCRRPTRPAPSSAPCTPGDRRDDNEHVADGDRPRPRPRPPTTSPAPADDRRQHAEPALDAQVARSIRRSAPVGVAQLGQHPAAQEARRAPNSRISLAACTSGEQRRRRRARAARPGRAPTSSPARRRDSRSSRHQRRHRRRQHQPRAITGLIDGSDPRKPTAVTHARRRPRAPSSTTCAGACRTAAGPAAAGRRNAGSSNRAIPLNRSDRAVEVVLGQQGDGATGLLVEELRQAAATSASSCGQPSGVRPVGSALCSASRVTG